MLLVLYSTYTHPFILKHVFIRVDPWIHRWRTSGIKYKNRMAFLKNQNNCCYLAGKDELKTWTNEFNRKKGQNLVLFVQFGPICFTRTPQGSYFRSNDPNFFSFLQTRTQSWDNKTLIWPQSTNKTKTKTWYGGKNVVNYKKNYEKSKTVYLTFKMKKSNNLRISRNNFNLNFF